MVKSHSGRESRVRFAAVALVAADGAVGDAGLPAVIAEAYAAVVGAIILGEMVLCGLSVSLQSHCCFENMRTDLPAVGR